MARLRKRVRGLAGFFGYDLDDPARLSSFTVTGSPRGTTLTGAELRRRRADFPELARLDKPVTPWAGNQMLTPGALGGGRRAGRRRSAPRVVTAQSGTLMGLRR
jgi:hypothetical protein